MFTAHLYLSLSAYLLFEAAWVELRPEMISILLSHSWIHISVSSHIHTRVPQAEGHNDHETTDIVFGAGDEDEDARNQAPKLV